MKSPQAFRSIGEVARLVGVATHVLRYWETQFTALAPVRRPDGRRYYRPEDLLLAAGLCEVMREDGLTIRGAQRLIALDRGASLRERGRLRLGAAVERKAAETAAGGRRTSPGTRARRSKAQTDGAAGNRQDAGQDELISAAPLLDGQGADRLGSVSEGPRPPSVPGGRNGQDMGNGRPADASAETAIPAEAAWLDRLTATAAALRAREQPLPADARPLHDALRRMQDDRS